MTALSRQHQAAKLNTNWMVRVCRQYLVFAAFTYAILVAPVLAQPHVWQSLPAFPSTVDSEPFVVRGMGEELHLFVVGADGGVYVAREFAPGGPFSNWSRISPAGLQLKGSFESRRIAVARNQDGRLEAFAWNNGRLMHTWQQPGSGAWGEWYELTFPTAQWGGNDLAVASNEDGRIEVFVKSSYNSQLYHTWQTDPNGGWSVGWDNLEGPAPSRQFTGRIVVGRNADGRLEVFTQSEGQIWSIAQTVKNSSWGTWTAATTSGGPQSNVQFVVPNADGRLEVFSRPSVQLWHAWQQGAGNWAGSWWQDLASPPGVTPGYSVLALSQKRIAAFSWSNTGLYRISQNALNAGWGVWERVVAGPLPFSSGNPQSLLTILNSNGQPQIFALANGKLFRTRIGEPGLVLKGTLQCTVPDGATATVSNPIRNARLQVNNHQAIATDDAGAFAMPLFTEETNYDLSISYEATIRTNLATGWTRLQVMNDVHGTRVDRRRLENVRAIDYVINLGTVDINTVDCEAWRLGVMVLSDYHKVTGRSPPANELRIKRWENVIVGSALTFYDVITIPTDYMTDTEYFTLLARERNMYHEFGHSIRHVADGSSTHWNWDNIHYVYAQDHDDGTVNNKGFAFNEGWGDFWAHARRNNHAKLDRTCVTAPLRRDWNEREVARRLMDLRDDIDRAPELQSELPPMSDLVARNDAIDRIMVDTLILNREQIHTLFDFESNLAERVSGVVPIGSPGCPPDFNDNGVFCERHTHSVPIPASGHCPCDYHKHRHSCFRNGLIFKDL